MIFLQPRLAFAIKLIAVLNLAIVFSSASFAQSSIPISYSREATSYDDASIVPKESDNELRRLICTAGSWLRYNNVRFADGEFDSISILLSQGWEDIQNGTCEVRTGSAAGPLITTISNITRTDWAGQGVSNSEPKYFSGAIPKQTGEHDIFLVFKGDGSQSTGGNGIVCHLQAIRLSGRMSSGSIDNSVYYVSAYGSDSNDGLSLAKPFKTITRAASVMKPGATCYIREGVYRETIIPAFGGAPGAPITFEVYNGENVLVSGADIVTGPWSVDHGAIYKTKMPWTVGKQMRRFANDSTYHDVSEYYQQLFIDGQMVWTARCPDVEDTCRKVEMWQYNIPYCSRDLQTTYSIFPLIVPAKLGTHSDNPISNEDPGTTFSQRLWTWDPPSVIDNAKDGDLVGAIGTVFTSWHATTGKVIASEAVREITTLGNYTEHYLTINLQRICLQRNGAGTAFLSNLKLFLDSPRECFWDKKDSSLYLWTPKSDNPSGHLVEAKRRMLVADLTGKNYVIIKGIKFFAGSLLMKNSSNCEIDKCEFRYVTHSDFFTMDEAMTYWNLTGFDPADGHKGIYISGDHNTIRNSLIAYSSASGIILAGKFNTVENCRIHSCNYLVSYDAGIFVSSYGSSYGSTNHTIKGNSIYDMGRSCISFQKVNTNEGQGIKIFNNDFYRSGVASFESGSIYLMGGAQYTECAYNTFHDVGGSGCGHIVLDVGHDKWTIHHNVFWTGKPVQSGTILCNVCADTAKCLIYNNTCLDTSIIGEQWQDTSQNSRWENPTEKIVSRWGYNNLISLGDTAKWKFTDAALHDYSLRSNSPAIDRGKSVPGVTLDYAGASPDLGAYEYNKPLWKSGANWKESSFQYPSPVLWFGSLKGDMRSLAIAPLIATVPSAIVVRFAAPGNYSVSLVAMNGRTVAKLSGNYCTKIAMPIAAIAKGIYLVRISTPDRFFTQKVILSRG